MRIARDPRLFSFLSRAARRGLPVVLGDARLTLAASAQRYDLIVLDAFSSDAIPVHLLTREALAGYLSRLEPGGVLVLHISNRHMELGRVVAAVGAAEGSSPTSSRTAARTSSPPDFKLNAIVAALARNARRPRRPAAAAGLAASRARARRARLDRRLLRHPRRDPAQEARPLAAARISADRARRARRAV